MPKRCTSTCTVFFLHCDIWKVYCQEDKLVLLTENGEFKCQFSSVHCSLSHWCFFLFYPYISSLLFSDLQRSKFCKSGWANGETKSTVLAFKWIHLLPGFNSPTVHHTVTAPKEGAAIEGPDSWKFRQVSFQGHFSFRQWEVPYWYKQAD